MTTTERTIPAWESTTLHQRFLDCVSLLHVHGIVSDTQFGELVRKIRKHNEREQEARKEGDS